MSSKWTVCSECGWKYVSAEHDLCPKCKVPSPDEPDMVRQWNSTLKSNPKKRPSRSPIKYRPRGDGLKKAMIKRAEKEIKEAEAEGRAVRCGNCKKPIKEIRWENISHRKTRGSRPDLATDQDNMDFFCGPQEYWGKVDRSCHTLWEHGRMELFNEKTDKYA